MIALVPALLAKLTLILVLGIVIAALLRSSAPSLRHLVVFAAIASSLVLPIAMVSAPAWNVALLAPDTKASLTLPPVGLENGTAKLHANGSRMGDAFVTAGRPSGALASPTSIRDVAESSFADESLAARALSALPLVWAVGFLAVLAWLATGRVRLRRIGNSAWQLKESDWKQILDDERREAGVKRAVTLCLSPVVSTPLTWGWRDPVILLPEDAGDWSHEHRRIVLRHELAHIARADSLAQLVAGVACALYWFHPLIWLAERKMRAECERACDDSVVSLGTPAADYAAHLLEVARSARAFGAPGFLSVAMARPSQLEGRLLAVLSQTRRRVSLSPGSRRLVAALSVLLLVPVAAFRAVPGTIVPARGSALGRDGSELPALSGSQRVASGIASAKGSGRLMPPAVQGFKIDSTVNLAAPVRSGGTLSLELKTGGAITITGWDRSEVALHASLAGRDWRSTAVKLLPEDGGAILESNFTGAASSNQSTRHTFEISVPRKFNIRVSSAGGSIDISGVDGSFTGHTGGGEINIRRANGQVDLHTGGGDVRVSDARLSGTVTTGGGLVKIDGVTGNLIGSSGSGPVSYIQTSGNTVVHSRDGAHMGMGTSSGEGIGSGSVTTISSDDNASAIGYASSGVRMTSAGGPITLPSAPEGAHVTTGGGRIRIGSSGGEVYAETGGGTVDIGPSTGSVAAHTGAGDVSVELKGAGPHGVDVTSGKGNVTLLVPGDLNAVLDLETAYTQSFKKTRIVSDFPLHITETTEWDNSKGTPRRYVRARETVGSAGKVIRVRTVNGDIILKRS